MRRRTSDGDDVALGRAAVAVAGTGALDHNDDIAGSAAAKTRGEADHKATEISRGKTCLS